MKSSFPGFPAEGIAFLRELKENNDREWFTPRKQIFDERVRLPMVELVRAIHGEMLSFAPQYVGEPAKCVFRIYRDTRFSKDKTPYKTHIAATMRRNGLEKNQGAGYYFSVSPTEIEVAGGLWAPEPDTLLSFRQRIAEDHESFRATFEMPKVRKLLGDLYGESAARAPKGFNPEHPAIDLLKRKHYVLFANLDPALATSPKLMGEIVKRLAALAPFVDFVNRSLFPASARGKKEAFQ
jgi:uncharacterized protein (TIGR02453 family)